MNGKREGRGQPLKHYVLEPLPGEPGHLRMSVLEGVNAGLWDITRTAQPGIVEAEGGEVLEASSIRWTAAPLPTEGNLIPFDFGDREELERKMGFDIEDDVIEHLP